ncbi:F-box domain, Leucine-rich repeat domain, L domain-like protein [Artemisia annua]|uniref:F-box domain, Leucine-rich repeat domain, L domain-like protein n=1 Tax=Artemisia annua TaxID=35608 RepID=A0A2U1MY61_ARTAN|nr:F-box domain, Leucine-rich repeat domain, L domain-like protein [Artemisia annua]
MAAGPALRVCKASSCNFAQGPQNFYQIMGRPCMADYISNMPENVISNILNRLPLTEAVTTSILAKNWRFKWTLLTDVILDEDFFYFLKSKFEGMHVTRLLLQLKGPIRRFVFSVEPKPLFAKDNFNYEEIHAWLLLLGQQGIEELLIHNWYSEPVTLPTQMYTRLELKHLKLHWCTLPSLVSFEGFPNLLTLELLSVKFLTGTIWDFIAGCPSVESLKINRTDSKEMRLLDIARPGNLKKLYLSFSLLNQVTTMTTYNISQLSSLPKLESLTLDFQECKLLEEGSSWMNVPVAFVSLKNLNLSGVDFGNNAMVAFIIQMIRGAPRLQMLETRCVLACSPLLKNLYIKPYTLHDDHNENVMMNWELARELLKLHRASPTAVVEFF